jgi:hypothetical protein
VEDPNKLGLGGTAPDSSPSRDTTERLGDYRSGQFVVTAVSIFNRTDRTQTLMSIEMKPF